MQIKVLSTLAISLSATAVFAVANVAYADGYENKDNIASISVEVADNLLNPTDIKIRQVWDEQSMSFVSSAYYDIYDYSNLTLTVQYHTGEEKSYSGTEITALSAKTETPFIIRDNQSESEWQIGTHTVTCHFGDKSDEICYTVQQSEIKSVTVRPMYDIEFIYGLDGKNETVSDNNGVISDICRYDLEGQYYEINITYTNGSTARYLNKEIESKKLHTLNFVQPEGNLSVGTHTAYCYVDGIKAQFDFSVIENPIEKIELYLPEGMDTLSFSEDAITDTDKNGNPYPRFIYDVSSLNAVVTYKDGTTANYNMGKLCTVLQDKLVIDDKQKVSPWKQSEIILNAKIRNIPCTLSLNIATEDIKSLKATNITSNNAKLSWDRVFCAGYELLIYSGEKWQVVQDLPFGKESATISGLAPSSTYKYAVRSYTLDESGKKIYTKEAAATFSTPLWKENLTITAGTKTSNSIKVSWSKSQYADGYIISVNGKQTATVGKGTTSYTLSKLNAATSYTISVKGYKAVNGNTIYSNEVSVKANTIPSNVTNFKASSRTTTSITLKWDKNASAEGYIINRYENGKWVRLKNIFGAGTTSYTITGLSAGKTEQLYIRAFKVINGEYVYSNTVYLNTLTNPAAVKNLTMSSSTSSSITVKWSKNTLADGYSVEVYKNGKWEVAGKITKNTTTSYAVKSLSPSAKYKIRVRAYKTYGSTTAYSSYASVEGYTIPSNVTNFKASSRTTTSITLKWDKNASAEGYIINRYVNGKWVRLKNIFGAGTTSYTITGLSAGKTEQLYIRAFKVINGKYVYSNTVYLNTLTNPAAVKNLTMSSSTSSSITVKWSKNTLADGYSVEVYKNGKWEVAGKVTKNTTTSFAVKSLSPSAKYKIRVRAYKTYGSTTAYSSYASVEGYTIPSNVTNFKASSRTKTSITLKWDKNSSAEGYIINRYENGKWVRAKDIFGAGTTSCTIKGLSPGKTEQLYIRAFKVINGKYVYSNTVKLNVSTTS